MRLSKCISTQVTLFGFGLLRVSFFFVLVASLTLTTLYSSKTFAADYYWGDGGPFSGSTPQAFCSTAATARVKPLTIDNLDVVVSGTFVSCSYTYSDGNGGHGSGYYEGMRYGDNCPAGTTYDAAKGTCQGSTNKCDILKGTSIPSFKFKSTIDAPSGTISKNGCAVELGVGICVTRTAPLYDCTFSGTVTGKELAVQDGTSTSDCEGSKCSEGQPQKETKEDPCSAIPTGSGFTCTSSKSEDTPGKSQCGTANGAYVCVDNPKPTSNASITKTEQVSTSNPDGSTTTKTTNTTQTSVCKGIGNCTSGTTVTVVTGGTNANGTNKPNSSTCTGPECGGGTIKPGNGTGSGDSGDSGDGEGEEGEEEKDSVSGDMACEALVACSGDVIQCAILRQEQQSRCEDKKFRDLSDGPVNDAKQSLTNEFAQKDYQPIKPDADGTHDISNLIKMDRFFTASCPVMPTLDIVYGDFNKTVDFNMAGFCELLTFLGYLNVAFALRRAAILIGTGV